MALEIYPMRLGEGLNDTSFLVWGLTPGAQMMVPVSAYLILGAEKPIMVDTGFRSAEAITAACGIPHTQSDEQKLEANLALHGLKPEDVGLLVHTHLHCDHTGLDERLPNARIIVQRRELQYASAPLFPVSFYDRVDIAKLVDPLSDRLELLEGDAEIAPGVRAVFTGGHAPGHQVIYVDVDSGQAIITGDLVYLADPGLVAPTPPGYYVDLRETMAALERIKRDARHVLPMHDPAVYAAYPNGVH